MKRLSILILFTLFSCSNKVETFIPFIEGYWSINQVKKNNELIKEYTINTSIDYFKVNDDRTGFRKKVTPKMDGTFIITQHETSFTLEVKDNQLNIIYLTASDTIKETITNASKKSLTITNSEGFTYIYTPFEKFDF